MSASLVEPLLSIDFIRGIFRRYDGHSKYTGKPKMTHRRDINDEDWQRFKEEKQVLDPAEVEKYRQFGSPKDALAVSFSGNDGPVAA